MEKHSPNQPVDTHLAAGEPLDDALPLTDSPPPKKWPWFLAALVIVIVAILLQFGTRLAFSKLVNKNKAALAAANQQTVNPIGKELPLPHATPEPRPEKTWPTVAPTDNVQAYLESRKIPESEELARLKLLAQLKARHDEVQKEEQAMLTSPATLQIGVGVQQASERKGANGELTALNPNTAYLKSISGHGVEEVSATQLGDLRFRVLKGKIIRGVTESAIDSDLPGMIRGHVTEDVYGAQGDIPLIHNGDELIGEYRSGDIRNGQVTLFVVWTRLRLQTGITVTLDSPGSDPLGRAGMAGHVDHHYAERYGSALLMSAISVGASTVGVSGDDRYNSIATLRQGASASFSQTANQELQQNMAIQNSIRPPQGTEFSVLINKDISFEDVLTQGDEG